MKKVLLVGLGVLGGYLLFRTLQNSENKSDATIVKTQTTTVDMPEAQNAKQEFNSSRDTFLSTPDRLIIGRCNPADSLSFVQNEINA